MVNDKEYKEVRIKKRSGGYRILEIPPPSLRAKQKTLLNGFLYKLSAHKAAHGFVKGRSITTNAKVHVKANVVVNIDIKDFFTSINNEMVKSALKQARCDNAIIRKIIKYCFYKGHLPQGAPTSPALANIVCYKLDSRLTGLAKVWKAKYTRYADDLTFSSKTNRALNNIIPVVEKILNDEDFYINKRKTRIMRGSGRLQVTGMVVNKKVNIPKEKAKAIRAIFHQSDEESDLSVLSGYVGYVKAVKKRIGNMYRNEMRKLADAHKSG